jgi:DNA gyrase subunit A
VVEALLRAIDLGPALDEAIESSADKAEARLRLTSPPFGFTPMEAEHVLDRMLWQRTRAARDQLEVEAADLRAELGRS